MKAVLVTGGAGYIGSHACQALAAAGYLPVAFDNLAYGHQSAVRWGPFVQGDVTDRAGLDAVFREFEPVAVMHFAAFAYVGESVMQPGKYYRNNVLGTLTLVEAMRDWHVDQLVFSSTCATYGVPQSVPIREEHPQHPVNPYGASKQMAEQILRDFAAAHGLRSIVLRYFNAAGADPAGEIGESHDPETHLIPLVLEAAAAMRPHVTIHGDQYATPDGTCVRDYIHVCDLANAHLLSLQALEAGGSSRTYNLGNGEGYSVREVIRVAQQVTGKTVSVQVGPPRPGDPARLVADATRIREELGWAPRHPDLATMVEHAWRWQQHQSHVMGQ